MKTAIVYLHNHLEELLTKINRVFKKNSPEGGLREVIRLLSWLVVVDEDDIFGEHKGITVEHYLKRYAKVSISHFLWSTLYFAWSTSGGLTCLVLLIVV